MTGFATNTTPTLDRHAKEHNAFVDVAAQFGATGDGTTDDSGAWNTAIAAMPVTGGTLVVPPGTYKFASQVTLPGEIELQARGAKIITTGAISGLRLVGGRNRIHGLTIEQQNANMTAGFEAYGTTGVGGGRHRFYDCVVNCAAPFSANFAGWYFHNNTATPADGSSGTYWNKLLGCNTQLMSGVTLIPYGVLIEGASNVTEIDSMTTLSDCVEGVRIQRQTGDTTDTVANSCEFHGKFEGVTTAIHIDGAAASNIVGPTIAFCRFESVTTILSLTGITTQPAIPPFLLANHYSGIPTTYINNPNALHVNALDPTISPAFGAAAMTLRTIGGLVIKADGATPDPLTLWAGGGNRGISLKDAAGGGGPQFMHTASGTKGRITGWAAADLYATGIRGLSQTTTDAENLRGSVTFTSGATKAVTFGTAEPNTSYFVSLAGNVNETFWVTAKATGGFTINSSNATSTAVVDWHLIR